MPHTGCFEKRKYFKSHLQQHYKQQYEECSTLFAASNSAMKPAQPKSFSAL